MSSTNSVPKVQKGKTERGTYLSLNQNVKKRTNVLNLKEHNKRLAPEGTQSYQR